MELTLLGTGCPVAHPERMGPAQMIRGDDTAVLVDCGSGVTQRLVQAGCPGAKIDALLLTHLHSDHLVDLFQLVISSWHQGRDRPLRVFGPRGTRRYADGLMALWAPELEQRIAHERRPSTAALEIDVEEIGDGWRGNFGGLSVSAFEVDHRPVRDAFGFAFETATAFGNRRVVMSGDTKPCESLAAAAEGADLLLNEVFVHREMPVVEGVRSAETVANVAGYHTASHEVGKLAAEDGVKALMLTHIVPPACDRAALLDEVAADYAGPLMLGEDLMHYDVARGRLTCGQAHLALGHG